MKLGIEMRSAGNRDRAISCSGGAKIEESRLTSNELMTQNYPNFNFRGRSGVLLLLMILGLSFCASAQVAEKWREIEILKSTRSEVEHILGKPFPWSVAKYAGAYPFGEGRIYVAYSEGTCKAKPRGNWNVPELTVTRFTVYLKPFVSLAEFKSIYKINEAKFVRQPDPEIIFEVEYVNTPEGISFTIDNDDKTVMAVTYFPSSKKRALRCRSN